LICFDRFGNCAGLLRFASNGSDLKSSLSDNYLVNGKKGIRAAMVGPSHPDFPPFLGIASIHYLTLNISPLAPTRAIGMLGTFAAILMGSGWLLYRAIG
jgi:hypothetical protein